MFGFKNVRMVASHVGTRNATQVRTHTQKYLLRKAEWDAKHNTDAGLAEKISQKQRMEFPEGHLAEGVSNKASAVAARLDQSPLQAAAGVPAVQHAD